MSLFVNEHLIQHLHFPDSQRGHGCGCHTAFKVGKGLGTGYLNLSVSSLFGRPIDLPMLLAELCIYLD